jgi:hypothetical protein
MNPTQQIKNQKGQVAIEYILLTVVMVGIFLTARNALLSNNTLANFVQKPWELVAGMIETGVWGDPKKARADHPGMLRRHISFLGDEE